MAKREPRQPMSTKSPEKNVQRREQESSGHEGRTVVGEEDRGTINNWDVPGGEPCTVYRDTAETLGRVTTPLGDLRFTNLYGSDEAMARQLGRRSSLEIREGALEFLGQFLPHVVEHEVPAAVARLGGWAAENWVVQPLVKGLPGSYVKMLRAYAEGAGIESEAFVRAQLVFDLWGWLERLPGRSIRPVIPGARRYAPVLGTASVVLRSEEDGPLHLRYFDNAAVDRWDRKTSVAFYHPDRGLSYVLVSSVGFLTGLPAGMNAAGLTLSVEPGGAGEVDLGGQACGPAAMEILSRAHTIEEGASILRQHRSALPWRYVMTEGDTGRRAILHVEAGRVHQELVEDSVLAISSADEAVPREERERVERGHRQRREALRKLTADWSGGGKDALFTSLEMMSREIHFQTALPGHPLCGLSNVGALVFEPQSRRVWVAAGRAPSGRRWFVPLVLRAQDGGGVDKSVRPIKPSIAWDETAEGRALENLRHAYRMMLAGEEAQRVLITLEYALALDSRRPAFHILAGLMALKTGRARRAQGAFERAIQLLEDGAQRAEVGLYLAWAFDLQRNRRAAKRLYGQLAEDPVADGEIKKQARKGRRRRYRSSRAQELEIDFVLATTLG